MAEGGNKAKNAGKQAAKMAVKSVIKKVGSALLVKGGAILCALCLIIFLFIAALLSSTDAQASTDGLCLSSGTYKAMDGKGTSGPNPTIVNIIWSVLATATAKLPEDQKQKVILATYEAAVAESGVRNLASDAIPESEQTNLDGTFLYPHDTYPDGSNPGGDHDSLGVFQQRLSGTWGGTGTDSEKIKNILTPNYATNKFVQAALTNVATESRDASALAQDVQVSAFDGTPRSANNFSSVYGGNYAAQQVVAQGLISQAQTGTAGAGTGTSSSGVVCTAPGALLVQCASPTDTGAGGCSIHFTSKGESTAGDDFYLTLPVGADGQLNEAGKALKAAATQVEIGYMYAWAGGGYNGHSLGTDGVDGFDCSGLTMYAVYAGTSGRVQLPHSSEGQKSMLTAVSQPAPGDLIFYEEGGDGKPGPAHVTMYAGKMKQVGKTWTSTTDGTGTPMVIQASQSGQPLNIIPEYNGQDGYGHPDFQGSVAVSK